jgi:hypothetical protein
MGDNGGAGEPAELVLLSEICLALPEASSDDAHPPHRGFRVAGKAFAYYTVNEHGSDRTTLVVRTAVGDHLALAESDPERYAVTKYIGRHGWVDYRLDLVDRAVDWDEVVDLVAGSYRRQAPKRLVKLLDQVG